MSGILTISKTEDIAEALKDDDLAIYVKHLKQIQKDMQEIFNDMLNLYPRLDFESI